MKTGTLGHALDPPNQPAKPGPVAEPLSSLESPAVQPSPPFGMNRNERYKIFERERPYLENAYLAYSLEYGKLIVTISTALIAVSVAAVGTLFRGVFLYLGWLAFALGLVLFSLLMAVITYYCSRNHLSTELDGITAFVNEGGAYENKWRGRVSIFHELMTWTFVGGVVVLAIVFWLNLAKGNESGPTQGSSKAAAADYRENLQQP